MPDRKTIDIYNTRAVEYADKFAGDTADDTLGAFMDRLQPAARVLDLGCGPGNTSAILARAGHFPDPLDASEGMIAVARERYGVPARQGDFSELKGPYDGVWANFSLLHMPRADIPAYLRALHAAMRPGAPLHIGMKIGEGEARDGIGRKYSYVEAEVMADWLRAAGFAPEAPRTGVEAGLSGEDAPWFTLTAIRS